MKANCVSSLSLWSRNQHSVPVHAGFDRRRLLRAIGRVMSIPNTRPRMDRLDSDGMGWHLFSRRAQNSVRLAECHSSVCAWRP